MADYVSKKEAMAEIDKLIEAVKKSCPDPDPLGEPLQCMAAAEIEALKLAKDAIKSMRKWSKVIIKKTGEARENQ